MNGHKEFSLRVPATAANLGPGFDTLGIALSLHNHFHVRVADDRHHVSNKGFSTPHLLDPGKNLFFRAYEQTCELHDLPLQALDVTAENGIPLQSGLGSSATAIIAGVAAAYLVHNMPMDKGLLLRDALRLESHPDNLGACLYGGFTIAAVTGDLPIVNKTNIEYPLICWVVHPHRAVDTAESRRRMPSQLDRDDVVYSLSRANLLVAALIKGELDTLWECMKDKLHEPWRMDPYMEYPLLKEQLRGPEFYGWAISGSGPSVISFCSRVTDRMTRLLAAHFQARKTPYTDYRLGVDNDGLVVKL